MLSLETLQLLKQILNAQQLQAGDPEFAETAVRVTIAQKELDQAIAAAEEAPEAS